MSIGNEEGTGPDSDQVKQLDPGSTDPAPEQSSNFGPLPRPRRARIRARSEKGLPSDEALARLARKYLEVQTKFWPRLVEVGSLLPASDEVIDEMVQDFKRRHRTGNVDHGLLGPLVRLVMTFAGMYCRYSCDNSSDLSIDDQMAKILVKAKDAGHFIPWCYVFCDYSVTGRDASRRGYTSYKKALEEPESLISHTWIDDFTRASRDEIEWWRLASLIKSLGKGLFGASDGFDLSNPNSDIMITVFGLVSRLFLKGLGEKVMRGMHGAASRGTPLGKLSLGFTRRARLNEAGIPLFDADGLPKNDICIDPITAPDRLRLYELFCVKQMTPFQIAQQFNLEMVDGWNGWAASGIRDLLKNPSAIGVFIWNKTRRQLDPETGEWTVKRNPRSEWTVKYRPELAIWTLGHWREVRRRLAASTQKKTPSRQRMSRNQISATTLFSGTLFCESCGCELKLIRSSEKYRQMGCINGPAHAHHCKMSSSKSVRVIEDCLLNYLKDVLLTDTAMEQIVSKANSLLHTESEKAEIDTKPLKAKERSVATKIAKLVRLVEESEEQSLTSGYTKRISELEKELHSIKVAIRNANVENLRRPQPLGLEQAKQYLVNLRSLLNGDIPEAAAAIRAVTGPISIREERVAGRNRARWVATFQPQWNKILDRMVSGGRGSTIETADLTGEKVEVAIESIPQYELLAEKFALLHSRGASIATLAAAHGMCWQRAAEILHFAKTAERPKSKSHERTGNGHRSRYMEIAEQVVLLRDQNVSFVRIAEQLNVGQSTVRRAYDYGRPDPVIAAAESATIVKRGSYTRLPLETFELIREKVREGLKDREIVAEVGCSASTVGRVRIQMNSDQVG